MSDKNTDAEFLRKVAGDYEYSAGKHSPIFDRLHKIADGIGFSKLLIAKIDSDKRKLREALEECSRELKRWRSCQAIGACRNCADDGVILRVDEALKGK